MEPVVQPEAEMPVGSPSRSIEHQELLDYAKERYQSVLDRTIKNLKVAFVQAGTDLHILEQLGTLWTEELDQALEVMGHKGSGLNESGSQLYIPQADGNDDDDDDHYLEFVAASEDQGLDVMDQQADIPQADGNTADDGDDDGDSDYVPPNDDSSGDESDDLQTVTSSKYLPYTMTRSRPSIIRKESASAATHSRAERKEFALADQLDVDVDGFGNYLGLEKPINADDDQTDEEDDEDWNTDCKMFCVIKKLARQQHTWRMELVDGIFHINGIDHFFRKAYLEAQW